MRFYNGFTEPEMADANGLNKLGIEKVKPFFTRGVLVDVAGSRAACSNWAWRSRPADVRGAIAEPAHRPRTASAPGTRCSSTAGGAACG